MTDYLQVMPLVMYAFAFVFMAHTTFGVSDPYNLPWQLPFGVFVFFLGFTVYAVMQEGVATFFSEHTSNFVGHQIWYDLLYCLCVSWVFILPKARELDMNIVAWFLFVGTSASIGLLPMMSRVLYLEQKNREAARNGIGGNGESTSTYQYHK